MLDDFLAVLISICKAQLIVLSIIVSSYIIEKITGLKLFIDHYTWVKSYNNIRVLSDRDTGYYIILMIGVIIYDIYHDNLELNFFTAILSIIIMFILVKYFYRIHKKYQKFDPNKADDDFT